MSDLPILSFQSVYLSLGNDGDPAPINYTDVGVFKDNGRYENTHVVEMHGRGNRRGGDNPDADGDGILDDDRHDSDVCVDEPYQRRYHADCLTEAGLELPSATSAKCGAMDELKEKYQIDLTTLDGRLFAIETLTFQQAAIETCRDLKTHERDMRKMRNQYRWTAIGTSVGGGVAAVIAGAASGGVGAVVVAVIVALVVTVLWYLSNVYGQYMMSAESAEYELCRFRR